MKLIATSLLLGFVGFLVSTYLTVLHYKNIIPSCSLTGGCDTVLTSKYSMVGPLPVALLGSLFFLAVIIICLLVLTNYKEIFIKTFYLFAGVGLLMSLILIFIQAYLLHSFCEYCLTCEASAIGISIATFWYFKRVKRISN